MMFTLFDLIQLVSPIVGAIIGGAVGGVHGIATGIAGALVGGFIGLKLGAIPTITMIRSVRKGFAGLTNPELESRLVDSEMIPNLILLELQARGEDVSKHLPLVLFLLNHDDLHRRSKGYAALRSAFPEIATNLKGYNPTDSAEACRQAVAKAIQKADQDAAP
ncbi:MAG: hypothetical protein ACFCU3_01595 [Verrucomicrobiales bacterium]